MSERYRILVVDDDHDMLATIRRALKSENYHVECFSEPQHALERLTGGDFDLLLSDVDMPGMTGHDVTRFARSECPGTIRVLVTGNATMDSAVRAINEGEVHRFIRKPFDNDDLRATVADALARKHELDLIAEASQQADRRRLMYEQLDAEHPGISVVERDADGIYTIDAETTIASARALGLGPFVEPVGTSA